MNHAVTIKNKNFNNAYIGKADSKFWFPIVPVVILLLVSALSLVYMKDLNRRLFISYQQQHQITQKENILWGQLLLEQSTWSTQQRIQYVAQKNLQMVMPGSPQIVLIK